MKFSISDKYFKFWSERNKTEQGYMIQLKDFSTPWDDAISYRPAFIFIYFIQGTNMNVSLIITYSIL